MSLPGDDPRLREALERLSPYAVVLVERAARHALRLHADAVAPEHLLSTLMDDEDSAACAAALHAFADPKTISDEALALSPGVLVVASGSTLPFSPLGVEALFLARERASRLGSPEVATDHLLAAAEVHLDPVLRQRLAQAGWRLSGERDLLREAAVSAAGAGLDLGEALFKRFSTDAKRSLSAANRSAAALRLAAIAPAHVILGVLQVDERLARALGIGFARARLLFGDRTADSSAPGARPMPADPALLAFLGRLRRGADSLDLLAEFLAGPTPDLAQLLARHKVTPELLRRSRNAFRDPTIAT